MRSSDKGNSEKRPVEKDAWRVNCYDSLANDIYAVFPRKRTPIGDAIKVALYMPRHSSLVVINVMFPAALYI